MEFHSPLLLFGFLIIISAFLKRAEASDPPLYHVCSNDGGNYTTNSTYNTNLNDVFSSVSDSLNNYNYGFYNYSTGGNNSDTVNALALCRGDVEQDVCTNCINNATIELKSLCPNQKEAIIWYDYCMFRYSNRSILGNRETLNTFIMWNANNVTNPEGFSQALNLWLTNLRIEASSGGSLRKFATGSLWTSDLQRIYGLVQCTPDISEQECNDCLETNFGLIPQCCTGKQGGRVIGPSCNFRYELSRFYEATPSLSTPPPSQPPQTPVTNTTTPEETKRKSSNTTIIIVVSTVVPAILIICIWVFLRAWKARKNVNGRQFITISKDGDVDEIGSAESLQYDFNTINVATNNFSDANKLGQGGFGAVYKGSLPNGQEVAVKRLAMNSGQGDLEFKNEAVLVAKLQHRNLVKLLGFCFEGIERLLVYEFVPNTSLDHFIFDSIKSKKLDWEKRYKIVGGIARGLLYLHEDSRIRIIHRDLKASNVLLDAEMSPKISDFGMARLFLMDQTEGATNRIVGTYGYMAPEYALYGQFSVKSDVFSFGVMVLEIVTGRKTYSFQNSETGDEEDLLRFAWRNWRDGSATRIVDPTILSVLSSELLRCIHIGLLCVQESVADRPTMASVVQMLNNYSLSLPLPAQPTFIMRTGRELYPRMSESKKIAKEDAPQSTDDALITEVYPR